MSAALRNPCISQSEFFAWAQADGGRWEFDGCQPVAMTGGTVNHSRICGNLITGLRRRLRGSGCEPLGPDAGIATTGDTVRYPDALLTCAKVAGESDLVPDPVVVFEVVSRTSGRPDRIIKVREYRAVPSIRRYVILEHPRGGVTVLSRTGADDDWTAAALTTEDTLAMPEIGVEVPVADFYQGVEFALAAE
jgi:Uma2 family endonuclease